MFFGHHTDLSASWRICGMAMYLSKCSRTFCTPCNKLLISPYWRRLAKDLNIWKIKHSFLCWFCFQRWIVWCHQLDRKKKRSMNRKNAREGVDIYRKKAGLNMMTVWDLWRSLVLLSSEAKVYFIVISNVKMLFFWRINVYFPTTQQSVTFTTKAASCINLHLIQQNLRSSLFSHSHLPRSDAHTVDTLVQDFLPCKTLLFQTSCS